MEICKGMIAIHKHYSEAERLVLAAEGISESGDELFGHVVTDMDHKGRF